MLLIAKIVGQLFISDKCINRQGKNDLGVIMDTIVELENYCNIENPVGALLLTGEWGSGKTYLIKNDLAKRLKDTHEIITISLFGISSVEEIHKAVKRAWLSKKSAIFEENSVASKGVRILNKVKDYISNEKVRGVAGSVLSIDFLDFIQIENKIGKKPVILVFDDLERSTIPTELKLGVINEYCENLHFNVIVIADEERIEKSMNNYNDFKEKVIQRTVLHVPNGSLIVKKIIQDMPQSEYKNMLLKYTDEISSLFSGLDLEGNAYDEKSKDLLHNRSYVNLLKRNGTDVKSRENELIGKQPKNIRSLKAALQDFERVFSIICKYGDSNIHKWLLSFVSFSMAAKANLLKINDKNYGYLFENYDLNILYPIHFDQRFMPESLCRWITEGIWEEDEVDNAVRDYYASVGATTPKDKVKTTRIDLLEETEAVQGLTEILPEAYAGNLSFNEYVMFICNCKIARENNLFDSEKVDWAKVCEGINVRIEKNIQDKLFHESSRKSIGEIATYSENEQKAYQIIDSARKTPVIMFEANRRQYISLMYDCPEEVFLKMSSSRFNCFDEEMAKATVDGFKKVDNSLKAEFPGYFEYMWGNYRNSFDISGENIIKTEKSLQSLSDLLKELSEQYTDAVFKRKATDMFIRVVESIISRNSSHKEEMQIHEDVD